MCGANAAANPAFAKSSKHQHSVLCTYVHPPLAAGDKHLYIHAAMQYAAPYTCSSVSKEPPAVVEVIAGTGSTVYLPLSSSIASHLGWSVDLLCSVCTYQVLVLYSGAFDSTITTMFPNPKHEVASSLSPTTFPNSFLVAVGDKHLYTVLEQQQAQIAQGNLMGSDHTYVMPQAGAGGAERRPQGGAARR